MKCCLLALWALLGTPAAAQEPPQPAAIDDVFPETRRFSVGLRAGAFEPLAFADSYDAIYGESLVPFGARFEFRPRRTPDARPKWFLALTTDLVSAAASASLSFPSPFPPARRLHSISIPGISPRAGSFVPPRACIPTSASA